MYYAGLVDNPRSLAVSPASKRGGPVITYASTRDIQKVWALIDANGDGRAERLVKLIDGLDKPNGIAWGNGDLYVSGWVGDKGMIWRFDDIDQAALAGKVGLACSLLWGWWWWVGGWGGEFWGGGGSQWRLHLAVPLARRSHPCCCPGHAWIDACAAPHPACGSARDPSWAVLPPPPPPPTPNPSPGAAPAGRRP